MHNRSVLLLAAWMVLVPACKHHPAAPAATAHPDYSKLNRATFNRRALRHDLPLFWRADTNHNGAIDADELVTLWGIAPHDPGGWVVDGKLSPRFAKVYATLAAGPLPLNDARHKALAKELAQGRPTLVYSDFSKAPAPERAMLRHIIAAAGLVERIYRRQKGSWGMAKEIPATDPLSRFAFYLNQGPWCSGATTAADPNCNALASLPKRISGLYPADVQSNKDFCKTLAQNPNHLMSPFTVVRRNSAGKLEAVPYATAYAKDAAAVAHELQQAAAAITDPAEAAMKRYLLALVKAYHTNDWYAADEAWAKMNAKNSQFYLRMQPDETYFEPCSRKAGFQTSFARINTDSLAWRAKLEPLKNEMEKVFAKLAGPPYKAQPVTFHLPDFIDIILNTGDARDAFGATVGESLPNWGPVANQSRGRTVVMTNLYSDPDSKAEERAQVSTLLCSDTMAHYSDSNDAFIMGTILHEATHNLGPSHEYKVHGKTDEQIFGGPIASLMEELKAQTGALFFAQWLAKRGVITHEQANHSNIDDIAWAFGQISRGMYDPNKKPKPYAELAAIQLGFLQKQGALTWHPNQLAQDGKDKGCMSVHFEALPKALTALAKTVAGIKSRGDVKGAAALRAAYVDAPAVQPWLATVAERWRRFPRASFVYGIRL